MPRCTPRLGRSRRDPAGGSSASPAPALPPLPRSGCTQEPNRSQKIPELNARGQTVSTVLFWGKPPQPAPAGMVCGTCKAEIVLRSHTRQEVCPEAAPILPQRWGRHRVDNHRLLETTPGLGSRSQEGFSSRGAGSKLSHGSHMGIVLGTNLLGTQVHKQLQAPLPRLLRDLPIAPLSGPRFQNRCQFIYVDVRQKP